MANSLAATTTPFQRLYTPARIVKMVWLQGWGCVVWGRLGWWRGWGHTGGGDCV